MLSSQLFSSFSFAIFKVWEFVNNLISFIVSGLLPMNVMSRLSKLSKVSEFVNNILSVFVVSGLFPNVMSVLSKSIQVCFPQRLSGDKYSIL